MNLSQYNVYVVCAMSETRFLPQVFRNVLRNCQKKSLLFMKHDVNPIHYVGATKWAYILTDSHLALLTSVSVKKQA